MGTHLSPPFSKSAILRRPEQFRISFDASVRHSDAGYDPALASAGWDLIRQIREQYFFTDGQVIVKGKTVKRGERKFADYVLFYKPNIPIAIIEAKDNNHGVGAGMQQGLGYAERLDSSYVFSTN